MSRKVVVDLPPHVQHDRDPSADLLADQRIADDVGLLSRGLGGDVDPARPGCGVAGVPGAAPPIEGSGVAARFPGGR